MANKDRRLYISEDNKMWLGICGGIGEYFDTDPTFIRMLWLAGTLVTGLVPGLIAYLACAVIIPKKTS